MSHNRYLAIIGLAGLLSWIGLAVVISKLNPLESPGMALGLFFATFFLALMCTFSVIGFYIRLSLNQNEIYYQHINISVRQGILLSLMASIAFTFQLLGVLTWWTGLLLVAALVLIEFYCMLKS